VASVVGGRQRWTNEQARRFLTSAREDRDPYYAAYVMILIQGLRKGEVLGLPEDADADLPLPAIVATALRQRLVDRADDETAAANAWQDSHLMFTRRMAPPIEPRNFDRSSHARVAKAGVPRITVHDGRRTCGSLLADLDVHPRVAMAILRHAQFAITMEIYTEVSDAANRAGLMKLGDSQA